MNDAEFLLALREYLEDVEILIENDRGFCRSLEELIAAKKMPDIYDEVLRRLEDQQARQQKVEFPPTP